MAWTQTDLDRIDAALAANVKSVTFSDGRQTTYQDTDKMLEVRKAIKAELLASASQVSPRVRATRGTMRRP
jgi:phage baseplate assembly protein gpV